MRDIIREYIHGFETDSVYGFTETEMKEVTTHWSVDHEKFKEVLGVNTVMVIDGQTRTYATDVESALFACLTGQEFRNWWEVD